MSVQGGTSVKLLKESVESSMCSTEHMSRVLDQNGVSQLYHMLEIYSSGPEPSMCSID